MGAPMMGTVQGKVLVKPVFHFIFILGASVLDV
jgi:hypothetical protein